MADYSAFITLAHTLIAKYGAACTWNSLTSGAPADPNKPHIPGNVVTVNTSVMVAIFPFDDNARQTFDIRGRDVPAGTQYGIMGAVAFIPGTTDNLTLPDGSIQRVTAIKPLDPAGTGPIIYIVMLQT